MEYRDELFQKTPFYMTYPMQNLYMAEMEYEKDMERMKELYPREVRRLQEMIERCCDEMEYEGSRMYDENPDRLMLEREAKKLLVEFLRQNPQYNNVMPPRPMPREEGNLSMQQYARRRDDGWLESLIHVLFHNEIYRRRCRNRRCSRWW